MFCEVERGSLNSSLTLHLCGTENWKLPIVGLSVWGFDSISSVSCVLFVRRPFPHCSASTYIRLPWIFCYGLISAIVGAGISGASCAHYAKALFGDDAVVTVFDRAATSGGRMQDTKVGNGRYEAGASILHPSNRMMEHFRTLLGLFLFSVFQCIS